MNYLDQRRQYSNNTLSNLKKHIDSIENLLDGNACVYATGSFGRLEAGQQSDLDLFIVSKSIDSPKGTADRLSNLSVILIKAELITAARKLGLPDFDGDGKYLECHSINDFLSHLGGPEDDYRNTLTGRLLMFLEGRPLAGQEVFDDIIEEVIAKYFEDFSDHSENFIPAFLCNDILRLWRTFCVNYEFARRKKSTNGKARIKNLKLKHSRMLTCFSAISYMVHAFSQNGTVSTQNLKKMVGLTPLERLQEIAEESHNPSARQIRAKLFELYSEFLERTDKPEDELIAEFDRDSETWARSSYEFGDNMSNFLSTIGNSERFMRLLIV